MRSLGPDLRPGLHASLAEDLEVLRCAAVYGANASGKSNLIKALVFARQLLILGAPSKNSKIRVEPFRLATTADGEPTSFEFYIYKDDYIYGYSFSVLASHVVAEKLTVSDSAASKEEVLFKREQGEYDFSQRALASEPKPGFTDFVAEGTRDNQLFAQEAHERGLSFIEPLFKWFEETLTIIQPDAEFQWLPELVESNPEFRRNLESVLDWADTGIVAVKTERRLLDKRIREQVDILLADPKRRAVLERMHPKGSRPSVVENESGDLEVLSITTDHRGEENSPFSFETSDESDGTLRLMHLAPMLYFADVQNDVVFVVDELDRSLHTLLAKELITRFLGILPAEGEKPTTQLIFTTHDTNLLDCNVLGHASIWFTEKNREGASSLYSLAEYPPEQLKELTGNMEKGYLKGRFGGIPFISDPTKLGWAGGQEEH